MTDQRRLAAILVADVVGYSKLMGSDEAGTLAQLDALRAEIIDTQIAKHAGRLFKSVGDGFLIEFASAVQAVSCAKAIQVANGQGRLPLRIGIHVGDVVVQGDDLMGDGVNVAARVEGIAEPGGIAITRAVAPVGMLGLLVSGIFAATMSAMDGGLNKSAGIFIKNFYQPVCRPTAPDRHLLKAGKVVTLVLGMVIILVALRLSQLKQLGLFLLMQRVSILIGVPITVPVLVMHGDDDQIVPYADSAPLSAKLLKNGTLKTYKGFPHGMPTTEAATINADLLAFIKA